MKQHNDAAAEAVELKRPVTVWKTKEYSGDVPQMSSPYAEVGYWIERYQILDANGDAIAEGIKDKAVAEHIAECINDHTRPASRPQDDDVREIRDALMTIIAYCDGNGNVFAIKQLAMDALSKLARVGGGDRVGGAGDETKEN